MEEIMEPVILFVADDSIYKEHGFDCYDKERDALTYKGDNPVVAHPPPHSWGVSARINYERWGGEHNRPGNDGGLFKFAFKAVERCGGVLEHPAGSYAWHGYGLVKPKKNQWTRSGNGWTCMVYQAAYGHRATKRTWLYYVGKVHPEDPIWDKVEGTHRTGTQKRKSAKPRLSLDEANATPVLFMEYLVRLARNSRGEKL